MLVLPPTLSLLEPDGTGSDTDRAAKEAKTARIAPGYRLYTPREGAPYSFYARVNVDAPQLWSAFEALLSLLTEPVGAIAGIKDEEPKMLPYIPKADVLPIFRLYKRELCEDALLEFGLIHQTRTATDEVYVQAAKCISVWGNDVEAFKRIMKTLGLQEIPDLRFIDEFPRVSSTLSVMVKEALHPEDVLMQLEDRITDLANDIA